MYVLGGFGGATSVVGELLGLATGKIGSPTTAASEWFEAQGHVDFTKYSSIFQPVIGTKLPLTPMEALDFVSLHSLGGPYWPSNGLSVDENRALFSSTNVEDIKSLVGRGLLRRFGYYRV